MNISKVTDTSQDSGLPLAFSANLCGPAILEHIVLHADLRAGVAYVATFSLNIWDILLGVLCAPSPSVLLLVQISISQESLPGSLHVPQHHLAHLVFTCHHFKLQHIIICVASHLMLVVHIMLQALWQQGQIASGPYQFPGHSCQKIRLLCDETEMFSKRSTIQTKENGRNSWRVGKRRQILLIQAISHLLFIDYMLPARSTKTGHSGCSLTS